MNKVNERIIYNQIVNQIKFQIIKTVWFANNPEKETLPSTTASGEGLSSMQKLLLFITIRPDKVIPAVRYDF